MRRDILVGLLVLTGSQFPGVVLGQDNSHTQVSEVVVVTAERRPEDITKVPVAVTKLSGPALAQNGVTTSLDLQNLVPSLTVAGNLGSREDNVFTIRGQSQPFGGADPGVQTYFAEVPFGASGPGVYYDLDNVQVLKGPQGTLFGRNTTGGAILFEPKRPTDEFGGYIGAQFGNYDFREVSGALNVPLDDTLAVRVAGDFARRDGFTRDVVFNKDLDNLNYDAFRAGVTWRPVSQFENYLLYDFLRERTHGTGNELTAIAPQSQLTQFAIAAFQAQGDPNAVADGTAAVAAFYPTLQFALATQQGLGPRRTTSSIPLFFRRDSWGLTDIAQYDFNSNIRLRNIFGYRSDRLQPSFDYDGSFLPILDIANPRTWESSSVQVTEELQLQGESSSEVWKWIAGFYHELDRPDGYSEVQRDVFGGGLAFPPLSNTEVDSLSNGGTSNALYASVTFDASELIKGLSFTAGGRYTWDHKVAKARTCIQSVAQPLPCPYPLPAAYMQPTLSGNFRAPSWTLTADYQIDDVTMLYATVRRGYKSGGFNSGAAGTGLEKFKPEYLTDLELGLKSSWSLFGLPATTSIDGYYGWYNNVQKNDLIEVLDPPARPVALTLNAAKATIKGIELETAVQVTDNLQVNAFYSYTDASYDKFVLPSAIFMGSFIAPVDHSGDPFAYTPQNKFGIQARWHIPVDETWGRPYLGATWYAQSKVWFSDLSDIEPAAFQNSYDVLNLRLDWEDVLGSSFDASAFVNNATDRTYKVGANALLHLTGTSSSIYAPPRMWGIELRYRFGSDAR